MANARTAGEQVVYASLTGIVRWSGGTTVLRKGTRYPPADRLCQERPDLFVADDPGAATASTDPGAPRRRCWSCRQEFPPSSDLARYCSQRCRRARERWLARMARTVTRGAAGDPRRPGADCSPAEARAYRTAVEGHAAALERFAAYLSSRCDPNDPQRPAQPDPDIQLPPRRRELAAEARRQHARVSHLVNDARSFEVAVAERAREQQRPTVPAGPGRAERLAELDAAVAGWAQRLEGEDGDV